MSKALKSNIGLRLAEFADCDKVFQWRNHPSVRRFSVDKNELDYASHKEWFTRVLSDEKRIMLIAVQAEEDVGVIRYDLDKPDKEANVSIYVKPDMQSRGIGTKMMKAGEDWLKKNRASVKKLKTVVSKENSISLKLFENAGFRTEFLVFSKQL